MSGQLGAIGELWAPIRKTFQKTMISPGTTNEMGASEFMGYTWIKSLQNKYRNNQERQSSRKSVYVFFILKLLLSCMCVWSWGLNLWPCKLQPSSVSMTFIPGPLFNFCFQTGSHQVA